MSKRFTWFLYLGTIVLSCTHCTKNSNDNNKGWVKYGTSPVLKKGLRYDVDFFAISDPCVIFDKGTYKMWYTAGGAVLPDTILKSRIGYATSMDGIVWEKAAFNPVLDVSNGAWDSIGVETATVIIDEEAGVDQRYKMWYAGQTGSIRYDIGFAWSADGISWTKHPGAVLSIGNATSWDNGFLEGPSVLKVNGVYKMWYASYDGVMNGQATDGKVNIGMATSDDGIHWNKYDAPVVTTNISGWDQVYAQDPCVLFYNNRYHMWYGGAAQADNYGQQTGYSSSTDGINWTKSNLNPTLPHGVVGAWDANTASFPSVWIKDNKVMMWYTGKDVEPLPAWPTPYFWEIGYAEKELPDADRLD